MKQEISRKDLRGNIYSVGYCKYTTCNKSEITINQHCMHKSFAIIMEHITKRRDLCELNSFFAKLAGYDNSVEMYADEAFMEKATSFTELVALSSQYRNDASHGGEKIGLERCKSDKNLVLSDLKEMRDNYLGLIQYLLTIIK